MKIDFMKMAEIMYNRQPLAFGAYFDENQPGEFHIIHRYTYAYASILAMPKQF